ncbi:hypothetical protein JCM3770_001134 [Rhodotorula araucariae]
MHGPAHPWDVCTRPLDTAPATRDDEGTIGVATLKARVLAAQSPHAALSTPRTRPPQQRPHKQRLSTALSLAESLTTPPPAYEVAVLPPSPSHSPRRGSGCEGRARSDSASDGDDPLTSDSDDPLNGLLRLTSSLLSTSTSILASSTALHATVSRLLHHSEAPRPLPRPPRPAAEVELRAADETGARLSALEAGVERWLARSDGTSGGDRAGGTGFGGPDGAERPRTVYVTALGVVPGGAEGERRALGGILDAAAPVAAGEPQREGDGTSDLRQAMTRRSGSAPSAAQDLLGRLAARGRVAEVHARPDEASVVAAAKPAQTFPSHAGAHPAVVSSPPPPTLDESAQDAGGADAARDLRKSASATPPSAGDQPSARTVTCTPRTPPYDRRVMPVHAVAARVPPSAGQAALSPQPSTSRMLPGRSSLWVPGASCPALASASMRRASPYPDPHTRALPSPAASPRPAHHHRRSSTLSGAPLAATPGARPRAGATTALASFAALGGGGDGDGECAAAAAAVPTAGGGGGAASALSALQALSEGRIAAAGSAGGVPSAARGMAEGKDGGGCDAGGARGSTGSWWSWS